MCEGIEINQANSKRQAQNNDFFLFTKIILVDKTGMNYLHVFALKGCRHWAFSERTQEWIKSEWITGPRGVVCDSRY